MAKINLKSLTHFSKKGQAYAGSVDEVVAEIIGDLTVLKITGWLYILQNHTKVEVYINDVLAVGLRHLDRPDIFNAFQKKQRALKSGYTCSVLLPPDQKILSIRVRFCIYGKNNTLIDEINLRSDSLAYRGFNNSIAQENFVKISKLEFDSFISNREKIVLKTSKKPQLSVVIVTFNRPELIYKMLVALTSVQSISFEVIVFDNCSGEPTKQLLRQVKGLRILHSRSNLHFLLGANQAAKLCHGKYLLFLNSDSIVTKGAIESSLQLISENKKVGTVGAKLLNIDNSLQEAGSIILKNGSTKPYGWQDRAPWAPRYNFIREVDYSSGAFLMTTNALFKKLDGFSADFVPAYYEDVDYCVRVQKNGFKNIYNPSAIVHHFLSASATSKTEVEHCILTNSKVFKKKHKAWLKNKQRPKNMKLVFHSEAPLVSQFKKKANTA